MTPSGQIFFKDSYEQFYSIKWDTINGVIDMTTVISQPYVWGKAPSGKIVGGVLFRNGVVTIERQVIRPFTGGYEIVADGVSQYEDLIQMNFPCQKGPSDPFKYHLNNGMIDECESIITEGPRWADPDDQNDADMIWGDIDSAGNPLATPTMTGGADILAFVDVWG